MKNTSSNEQPTPDELDELAAVLDDEQPPAGDQDQDDDRPVSPSEPAAVELDEVAVAELRARILERNEPGDVLALIDH